MFVAVEQFVVTELWNASAPPSLTSNNGSLPDGMVKLGCRYYSRASTAEPLVVFWAIRDQLYNKSVVLPATTETSSVNAAVTNAECPSTYAAADSGAIVGWRCGVDATCGRYADTNCTYGCGELSCWSSNEFGSGSGEDLGSGFLDLLLTPPPASPICTPSPLVPVLSISEQFISGARVATEGDVLIDTSNAVMIYHSGEWRYVCDDSWGIGDAEVVCRQLGLGSASSAPRTIEIPSDHFWLDDVECSGSELRLSDCSASSWGSENCATSEGAGAICTGSSSSLTERRQLQSATEGDVRIESDNAVMIYHSSEWRYVCDDSWGTRDADVVCRQLGLGSATSAPQRISIPRDSFWLDDVACSGSESRLSDCSASSWGRENCATSEGAGAVCTRSSPSPPSPPRSPPGVATEGDVRLESNNAVMIYHSGSWKYVCDDSWGMGDANVVCRQLGLGSATSAPMQIRIPSDSFWLDNVGCRGSESRLSDCPANSWGDENCGTSEGAGAICAGVPPPTTPPPPTYAPTCPLFTCPAAPNPPCSAPGRESSADGTDDECVWGFTAFVIGFFMLGLTILFFHFNGPCDPKPRWQDKICEPHVWRTAPNGGCLVITIIMAIAQLAMGIVLVSLPKYGFAEDDYYSFSARRGVCEFQNVNDDGDSSASTWGVLHIVFGAWSTFWTWQALANLDKYNRIHRRGGNQNARARPNQAVDVHGEGTLIQSWNNIGRHGGRWQSIDRRVDHPRGPYRQYALEIYRNQDGTHGTVQLGRIQFKDQHGLEVPYQSHTINNERCHGNGGEHIRNLSNGGHGKWCTQLEYFPRNTPRFVFTFNGPVTIATVVLTSANDMPQRDPSQFALLGVGPVGEVNIEMVPLHLPGDIPPLPQAVVQAVAVQAEPIVEPVVLQVRLVSLIPARARALASSPR